MSETVTTQPDGVQLPLDSLEQTFINNGNSLSAITVQYQDKDGVLSTYKQTFTYAQGFALDSVTVDDAGIFSSVNISTAGSGSGAVFVPSFEMVVADPDLSAQGVDYSVDDIITMVGGVNTVAAQARVTNVDINGAVLSMSIETAGVYSSLPTSPVETTGGSGTGLRMSPQFGFLSIGLSAAGAGYNSGSTVVFTGNIFSAPAATLVLSTTDTGGAISKISGWVKQ